MYVKPTILCEFRNIILNWNKWFLNCKNLVFLRPYLSCTSSEACTAVGHKGYMTPMNQNSSEYAPYKSAFDEIQIVYLCPS